MERVEVDWVDSQGEAGWKRQDLVLSEAAEEDMVCRSVGYLMEQNERYLLLAQSHREETENTRGQVADTLQIPAVAVVKVTKLKT